ncbi:PREDICTED: protein FAM186A-like [Thamnophis sirtalis]|uniref:Protein FAM186A-like n=1 Tax=Thamnophis sirtalis TaxID=35019 RepID=A0A6I9XT58_9SAUR|nr:PREDICTED: protein FAM186A-like [Thamnophis sirtalis]
MNFQRFVAWENLPSLTPKSDDFDSSSLNSESVSEYESGGLTVPKVATTKKETMPNEVEIPISVRRVLDKIDVAQLERAKKEISKKLFRILENVNRVYERYKKDDAIDPKIEKEYNTLLTWEEKNRRSHFLDEIDSVLNQNTDKLLELHLALESFKECSGMLKNVELEEELIPSEEMVQKMEVDLLKLIERIEENVLHLIKLFQPLFAEKLKAPRKPGQKYTLLFKVWRDKVADTPQEGEPLTPEQMLDDEALAFSRCHDVNNMIHELGESQFFNKAEIVALKYTATMVGNLIKAFSLLVKQCRNLKLKCDSLTLLEGRKQDPQVLVLQRELRMAMERKTALEKQVQSAEERCMALLVTNEMIQKELQDANEKASMADKIPLSKVTAGKTQSKASILEKDVKSKPAEKPKLPTEPKKKLPRKVEETMDERWDSQGEDSQISLLSIYGRDRTPTGSFLDIKMKQRKTVSDKGKIKQPPKATDEKGPPMHGTVTERSPALLDQMLTSHKTLDTESDKMVPKSSDEKPVETSPSTMEYSSLTEPTAEDVSGLQKDRKGARRRLSMKGTVDKVLLNVKTKKIVKFPPTKDTPTVDMPSEDITPLFTTVQEIPEGESTQMPTMTSETKTEPETLDKTLTQTVAAEKSEEALKQLQEKSKEIREKKETKRWSKLLQVPKQAAKSEGVRHGLDAKLQETARDIPTQEIPSLETPIQETPTQDKLPVDTPTQDSPTQVILTLDTPSQDTPTQVILPLDTPPQDIPPQDTPQEITRVELTHTPTTASETKEEPVSQDKDLTQTAAAKQTEEAPKQLPEKSKEIREKKETKRWGKLLQVQKQAEKSEGVRHGGDAKLQETARDMPTPSIPTPDTPTQDISGGELTQKPPTTSETKEESESQHKNLTQTAIIEQAEEAPKQLPEKSKDIREKKETKRWSKVLPSKKAEKSEGVRHGADAKLQETARDIPTPSIPTPDTPTQDISGGELTQKPTTTSETKEEPEFQDKDLVQTVIAEEIEEAPKQLPEKSKDIREKKETKRWKIPIMVPPPGEIPTMVPSPLEISTVVSPPLGIPSLVPPPLEIPSLVPPPLDISPLVLPLQDIPTLVSPPLESPTLLPPPPPQDILPLVPPPQEIPTLVSPPQDISPLVLPPPPKEISPLVQPPQVIPSLVPTPLERSTLALPPSPQEIPTLIPSPQVIPTLVPPPPDMPILVPPPEDMPILILPPKKVPILVPPPQDKELFTPQDIPKGQEKEEDLAKALPLTKEEQSLKHVPDEGDRWVKELKQEDEEQEKSKISIPISEEQPKTVDKGKEPSPKVSHSKLKSLQELNMTRELWYQQVQKELLTEKERMQEEQLRIQGECQQIEKAKENLVQWQGLFQKKQEEWKQKEEQHKEQEHLWQRQLEQWRRLQQQNNHYQQYWAEQREKQKEQQCRLQEEVRQLQQQYKQHVILQGEQAKEQWCWNRLKEEHRKQQEIWQEEDKEYESKRRQWQQQQAKHEGQMEALRQAHLQQEEQYKQWQKEQQRKQQELEHAWEKRCQQQLQNWQQKMQKQQEQESRDQEQKSKVPEKQRQKEPKPLSAKLKVVETSVLDIYVKPCKMPPVSKEKIISTTPRTPSPSIALKEDSSELETTWFPKMFTKIEELPSYGIAEKRYWINVDAQRKNLKLLREASQRAGISPDLYNDTKETIKQALHSNVERLAMLICKYKSLYNLHEVRQSLILQLDTAREANDGARMQNLYKMVDKVDAYQKKLLDNWKVRQNVVEKQRQHCLTQMVDLFAQVHSSAQLHLSNPCLLIVKAEDSTKETFHMPQIGPAFLKSKVYKSPLIRVKKSQDFTVTAMVRRKPSSEQIESLWKTDITELSFPLGPKAPVSVLWPETSGFPDIPRFLELDISSVRGKPLQFMETRIQNIPRWKISGYNFKHL